MITVLCGKLVVALSAP
ncbi:hypothetical protein MRO13_18605 (plasmid) [Vibrio metschnikovii]|nr:MULTISPECIES: hypothetical protein [Vibrio]MCU8382542.1 hypothetical protein [Vibrio vulnificus]